MGEELSDIQKEREALRMAVEKNRLEMRRAWVHAESLDGALQSAKETRDKIVEGRQDNPDSP